MKDGLGSVQSALVLGGGSDIGLATARTLVAERARTIVLAARKPDALVNEAEDLRRRGAREVDLVEFDADALETHAAFVEDVFERHGDIDLVLVAFGVLGDQAVAERDPHAALRVLHTNLLGAVSAIIPVVERLRAQGHGDLVVLSSVAGERGRRSNFVYGSSKAGLDVFCQGLGDSLAGSGVHVTIVRPGFVHTKMTRPIAPPPLATTPQAVARAIVEGVRSGADIVWVPAPMRFVMSGLRHLPRAIFRKLEI